MERLYQVYVYGQRMFTAKELVDLQLKDNELVRRENGPWRNYGNAEFQRLLYLDLGYTIDDDGTLHRIPTQSNSGYTVGSDGTIYRHQQHTQTSNESQQYTTTSTPTNESDSNCLGIIAAFVLPFVVLFGLCGISRKIYFYLFPLTHTSTLNDVYNGEMFAQSLLMTIYLLFSEGCRKEDDEEGIIIVPFIITAASVKFFPMSSTAAIIILILGLVLMIYSGYKAATE